MLSRKTIVLVLRSGGDFGFRDVELIARHINGKWKSEEPPRIICLWDKASEYYDLGNMELVPLRNNWPRWWARMILYSPEMEQYRPFLYIDLDTVVVTSLENIFNLVIDQSLYITLEDFSQKRQIATGLAWIPANSKKVSAIWNAWLKNKGTFAGRMDYFLRKVVQADKFWQELTPTIKDFKANRELMMALPENTDLVCLHGKPRMFDAINKVHWLKMYVKTYFDGDKSNDLVTVIIPYKKDRGWLKQAVDSVPKGVQLLLSQGEGNWPENFNKVLDQAKGKYIKWLHEDDMLTPNSIEDSIKAIEEQGVDFIHGEAFILFMQRGKKPKLHKTSNPNPTWKDLMTNNSIHSATLMYRREVFEKVGRLDETLNTEEEYEFNLRCLKAGLKIGYCPKPLAYYRRHMQQKVRTTTRKERLEEKEIVNSKYVA